MATIDISSPTSVGGRVLRFVFKAAEGVGQAMRAYAHRRAVNRLLYFDAHTLRDMGITPGDVHAALSAPLTDDPSRHLQALASERRAARRRQVSAHWPYR